jgi:ribosome-binding protein aMBF1 (putative translation factor)
MIAKFTGPQIRNLRQRLGWSQAEMARRMGCKVVLIENWEADSACPSSEDMNQLRFLLDHVETASEQVLEKPLLEKEMQTRGIAQLTHRDLLKDIQ